MTEKSILKSKKGAAMEWAIIFGLVIFGICALLVIVMTSFSASTRAAGKIAQQKSDLDQVGEYFMRAMGTSGLFPAGHVTEDTDFSSDEGYSWMDQETVDFFKRCEKDYGFSYSCEYKSERGSFLTFNRPEAFYRKLTVTKADEPVLTVVIAEDVTYEKERGLIFTRSSNPVSTFNILEWTTNDSVENPDFESESEDELSFLQKLLQCISSLFGMTGDITPGFEIRYDPNGGDIPSGVTFAYCYPEKDPIILTKAVRGGYDFIGWFRRDTDEKGRHGRR